MRLAVGVVVALLLVAGSARAEDRDASRQAFLRASQHYKLGEYSEALVEFKLAFRNHEDASYLYNIAQCYRQLGKKQDAVREYRMYLSESPSAPNGDYVRVTIAKLEQEMADENARARAAAVVSAPIPEAGPVVAAPHVDAALVAAPTPRKTPAYKKWWVWTITGVVVAGGAAGLAVALTRGGSAPTANTVLGTAHPFN